MISMVPSFRHDDRDSWVWRYEGEGTVRRLKGRYRRSCIWNITFTSQVNWLASRDRYPDTLTNRPIALFNCRCLQTLLKLNAVNHYTNVNASHFPAPIDGYNANFVNVVAKNLKAMRVDIGYGSQCDVTMYLMQLVASALTLMLNDSLAKCPRN